MAARHSIPASWYFSSRRRLRSGSCTVNTSDYTGRQSVSSAAVNQNVVTADERRRLSMSDMMRVVYCVKFRIIHYNSSTLKFEFGVCCRLNTVVKRWMLSRSGSPAIVADVRFLSTVAAQKLRRTCVLSRCLRDLMLSLNTSTWVVAASIHFFIHHPAQTDRHQST